MYQGSRQYVNLKCTPADDQWPEDREMTTVDFGAFLPGEVKRVQDDGRGKIDRLLASGEFEVTEDEPNSEEIRKDISERKVNGEFDEQTEEEEPENP